MNVRRKSIGTNPLSSQPGFNMFQMPVFTCGGAARSMSSLNLVLVVVVLRKFKVSEAARVFIAAAGAPPIDPTGLYPHVADGIP